MDTLYIREITDHKMTVEYVKWRVMNALISKYKFLYGHISTDLEIDIYAELPTVVILYNDVLGAAVPVFTSEEIRQPAEVECFTYVFKLKGFRINTTRLKYEM